MLNFFPLILISWFIEDIIARTDLVFRRLCFEVNPESWTQLKGSNET